MNVQIQLIDSLDDLDFDALFAASYTRIEKNFIWDPRINEYEARKNYYAGQLQQAIEGTWPHKNDTDTFIMFTTTVDGVLVDFSAGYLQTDGIVSLRWNLASEGINGNHNWRFSPEARVERKRFSDEIGAAGFKHYTWVGSLIYRMLKLREQAGHVTLEESPTVFDGSNPHPNHQLVSVIVRFN